MGFNNVTDTIKVGQRAIFMQEGGSSPDSKPLYRGETSFGGWNTPQGDVTATYLPNPARPSQWDIVDLVQAAQGLPTSDFSAICNMEIYKKWLDLKRRRCPVNIFIKQDSCGRKDDLKSWELMRIISYSLITDFTDAIDNPLTGDDEASVTITGSYTGLRELIVNPIGFEEVADTELLAESVDGFFAGTSSCGGKCGERVDDCSEIYVLQTVNTGSPGLSSGLIISIDNGQTWDKLDIPTLGGIAAHKMDYAGSYIVVISNNQAKHHFIRVSDAKALDASGWDSISTNYVGGLYSIWSKSPAETYIGGAGGYAYKLTDPSQEPTVLTDGSITTENLTQVSGWGSTVVFAGNAGKVLVSRNNGDSFVLRPITLKDGSVITGNVTALRLISQSIWLLAVGGTLYYTLDAGVTYKVKALGDTISVINDIFFEDDTIGYLAAEVGGAGRVYRTFDSGNSWDYQAPSIQGLPSAQRISFVTACGANRAMAGGRVSVGGDGMLAIAQ